MSKAGGGAAPTHQQQGGGAPAGEQQRSIYSSLGSYEALQSSVSSLLSDLPNRPLVIPAFESSHQFSGTKAELVKKLRFRSSRSYRECLLGLKAQFVRELETRTGKTIYNRNRSELMSVAGLLPISSTSFFAIVRASSPSLFNPIYS